MAATKSAVSTKALAEKAPAHLPAAQAPDAALMGMMDQDVGAGMEGTDKDSFAIPFIRVLQQLSPQCTPGKAGYNKLAKPGMLFNTATGELIDGETTGIIFQPCAFQRRFIQWAPRASGGGYKGEKLPEQVEALIAAGEVIKGEDDGKLYLGKEDKKSDFFSDTRNHYGLVNGAQALLSVTSTQIKKSKQLMGILSAVRINGKMPPTWMNKIHLTTVQESNDQGSWYGLRVEHAGFIETLQEYALGKSFHDLIAAGEARVEYRAEDAAEDPAEDPDTF